MAISVRLTVRGRHLSELFYKNTVSLTTVVGGGETTLSPLTKKEKAAVKNFNARVNDVQVITCVTSRLIAAYLPILKGANYHHVIRHRHLSGWTPSSSL